MPTDNQQIVIVDRRSTDEWRALMDVRVTAIEEELVQNSEDTRTIKAELAKTKDDTREIRHNTSAIVTFFNAAQGGLKVLGWFGAIAKWAGIVAAAVSAIWVVWYQIRHGGELPKGK